jgi:hypothetical protein
MSANRMSQRRKRDVPVLPDVVLTAPLSGAVSAEHGLAAQVPRAADQAPEARQRTVCVPARVYPALHLARTAVKVVRCVVLSEPCAGAVRGGHWLATHVGAAADQEPVGKLHQES